MDETYGDASVAGRIFAVVLVVTALAALFVYRVATTDPRWEDGRAAAKAAAAP